MTSLKKFSVVLFTKDNTYAVVPSTWIVKESSQCYWPGKKTKNPTKLSEDWESFPDSTFRLYKCEFIKSYETYEKASSKAGTLRTSDKAELPESSDTDFGKLASSGTQNGLQDPIPIGTPAPPSGYLYGEEQEEIEPPILAGNNVATEGTSITLLPDPNILQLKADFEAFQIECFTKLEEVKSEVRDLKDLLRRVLDNFTPNPSSTTSVHAYPTLPLQTKEELRKTNEALQSKPQYDLMVNELRRIGGPTVSKNTYNVLRHLISPKLALEVRYTDKSGKLAFGDTRLARAIRDAVISVPRDKAPDEDTVNSLMGAWFRNSTDRPPIQGKSKCARKKQNQSDGSTTKDKEATNTNCGGGFFNESPSSSSSSRSPTNQ